MHQLVEGVLAVGAGLPEVDGSCGNLRDLISGRACQSCGIGPKPGPLIIHNSMAVWYCAVVFMSRARWICMFCGLLHLAVSLCWYRASRNRGTHFRYYTNKRKSCSGGVGK